MHDLARLTMQKLIFKIVISVSPTEESSLDMDTLLLESPILLVFCFVKLYGFKMVTISTPESPILYPNGRIYIKCFRCMNEDTASYVMKVIACPGMMRIKRGVIPFQSANTPSSFAIKEHACKSPVYLGSFPNEITCFCNLVLTTSL